jgi:hypothetical protein
MQFTHQTLTSTSKRFSEALNERGLELPFSATQNTWAQIVVGKNFSAALACANDHGHIIAVQITEEAIQAKLRARNREIDAQAAADIFAKAIRQDLPELSISMTKLVTLIGGSEQTCLVSACSDDTGLGIMDAKNAGYLPVSNMRFIGTDKHEVAWLRCSADLVATTVNTLAGVSIEQSFEILAASSRAGNEKEDQVFAQYFGARIESCCQAIVEKILKSFDPAEVKEWEVDFDDIRGIVFDVFERDRGNDGHNWLKPECAFGEAMIDHLGARLRETLKWLSDQANDGEDNDSPLESLMQTARLSMRKILSVQVT